ncbi:MAG: sulfate adenylyltransferase [Deltaproteobacteria bacterium CG11_big_fil_rev_8_21_14_0_20_45_16]|nr:MAG: sulfate adenylyltransferase [Deltaproteobacteria bacterium CG11_big_fil_rev_8_21_14_0_20_45_16]
MTKKQMEISKDSWMELQNFQDGVFAPLEGFMLEDEYRGVVDHLRLPNQEVWSMPISLEIDPSRKSDLRLGQTMELFDREEGLIGEVEIQSIFEVDLESDIREIYGTTDLQHPGVKREMERSPLRIGGRTRILKDFPSEYSDWILKPAMVKAEMSKRSWETAVGFQTRNPIHRAHEYLQRIGMEVCDGILIHPLIGWKKSGDFQPEAVIKSYLKMLELFYPQKHVIFGCLMTPMRYAGPREAIFHACIRRNFGCTHFIVGRDHAGVGNFYEKYAAQQLCRQHPPLGVKILELAGPYYSRKLKEIATENSAPDDMTDREEVSGTLIREMLGRGEMPPEKFMRPEVSELLLQLASESKLFNN